MGSLLRQSGTAGRPWEYTGPVSLLKSALQKNIRRGRAEEAVRWAVLGPEGWPVSNLKTR